MQFKQKAPFTFNKSVWGPLKQIVAEYFVDDYMYMGSLVLETVGEVHQYKHVSTRRSFLISDDGECYRWSASQGGHWYEIIPKSIAFDIVFEPSLVNPFNQKGGK